MLCFALYALLWIKPYFYSLGNVQVYPIAGSNNHQYTTQSNLAGMSNLTTYVLLIRHGENDWVGTDRLAGRTPGVHLNEKGTQQAADLAQLLTQQPIAAVYSSPLERCLQTAQPTAAALGLPVQIENALIEVDYGDWRGANLKELAKLPEWQMVQHFPSTFRFPQGETLREVQSRVVAGIEVLHNQHPNQVIALFSHGDIIRTAIAHYIGAPLDLFQRVAISTAAISVVGFTDQRPQVLAVNYTAALPKFEIK
jgi:probable phosphoglycerate mutase